MRRARLLTLALALAASTASTALADPPGIALPASAPMPPEAFETYATGRTLSYAQDGTVWGTETYLPGRHVVWRALGEDCKMGHWWPEGAAVCFSYDDGTASQCWQFYDSPQGLRALFLNTPGSAPAVVQELRDPVPCPGPEIGS